MSWNENGEWTIGRLLGTASGYWQPCALHAAVKLDVFSLLNESWLAADDIRHRLQGSERGVPALLQALTAMGLLQESDGQFANTEFSRTYLDRQSPHYKGYIIMHHHHLVDAWAQLDQAVLSGEPVEKRFHGEERERESFIMGMFNLAADLAPLVAAQVDLHGRRHLLDLGGGPGTYAVHFCLANPGLRATVYDRATSKGFARHIAARFEVAERVDFQAGDFHTDPLAGSYDAAWLSHILHGMGPAQCEQLMAKTAAALEPGGVLMVHEFFLDDHKTSPLFPALFSLNMLVNNEGGRSYSEAEVADMLRRAGAREIRRLPFRGPNDSGILAGIM